jgi:broad specificity phosphatase PhoE
MLNVPTPMIYLARHATPDWSRTDIPYHIPPGPPLTPLGEQEAAQLGCFLRDANVARVFASPLDRAWRTAEIASAVAEIPWQRDDLLTEWRPDDKPETVRARLWPAWEQALALSLQAGPIMFVSHGGPIALLLDELGLPKDLMAQYKRLFDRNNPLPPAGVWKATRPAAGEPWDLSLAFVPDAYRKKLMA